MKPKDTYKYHLARNFWRVIDDDTDDEIGQVWGRDSQWHCSVVGGRAGATSIHSDHATRKEASDCVYGRWITLPRTVAPAAEPVCTGSVVCYDPHCPAHGTPAERAESNHPHKWVTGYRNKEEVLECAICDIRWQDS